MLLGDNLFVSFSLLPGPPLPHDHLLLDADAPGSIILMKKLAAAGNSPGHTAIFPLTSQMILSTGRKGSRDFMQNMLALIWSQP